MGKYLILLIIQKVFISPCLCQGDKQMLIPFEDNGLWGYMNLEKRIIVTPRFDEAYPTYGQMGRVRKNGKYGFVNNAGEIIVKLKYDTASDSNSEYATVVKNNKQRYLNNKGKINTRFSSRCGGTGGMYLRSDIPYLFKGENNKYGFAFKRRVRNEDETVSFKPDTLPPIFDTVFSFGSQVMCVMKEGKIAFASSIFNYSTGSKFVLERMNFIYDEIKLFNYGNSKEIHSIVGVRNGNFWGYYDVDKSFQGEEVAEPKYYSISIPEKTYVLVEYEPNRFGYIDWKGNEFFWRGHEIPANE